REHWRENHPDQDCSGDDCPGDLGALLLGLVFGSPFYVPALAIGDYYNKTYELDSYPYARDTGYLATTGKNWLIRAGASRLWSAHDAQAWMGELSFYTASRFGLDSSYTRYSEHTGDELDSLAF